MSTRTNTRESTKNGTIFAALAGLTALAVLLQGLWAGIFLEHDGKRDAATSWINLHARGGEVALVLAAITTMFAVWKLRTRRDLWIGGAILTVLLILESYLGGLIVDNSKYTLTAVHVPLGMAIMGLVIWIAVRIRVGTKVAAP